MRKIYLYLTFAFISYQASAASRISYSGINKFEELNTFSNFFRDVFQAEKLPPITGNLFFCSGSSTVLDAGVYDSYLWSSGATTQTISVNTSGTYTVTVDDGGTPLTFSETVVEFQNPTPIITGNSSFCSGTNTQIDAGAGYTDYLWNSGSSNQTISVSTAGTYTVTVTDGNTCTASANTTIIENPNPTPIITGNLSYCIGFSTTLDAGSNYTTYLWNDGSSVQTLLVSNPGDYTVTVTDGNGCTGSTSVSVIQNQATTTNISANGPLTFCDGDSVRLSADLGYSSYLWSNGAISRTTKAFSSGVYIVTVTDANGCTSSSDVTVTVNPNPIISDVDSTEVDCNGNYSGTFEVIASGGTGPYGYSINGVDFYPTGLFTGLPYGSYTITVVDSATSCTSTKLKFVGQPDAITAFNTTIDNACYGEAQGSIDLSVDGGVMPYTYLWSNGSTDEDPTGLVADIYTVTVTDVNNCTYQNVYEILEPSQITIGTQQTNVSCSYGQDGTAYVDVNGGTPGYTYLWSDGQTDAFAFGLEVGVHIVTITDANGCDTTMTFTIAQPSQLNTTSVENNVSCYGASDGSVTVSPYGGTPYILGEPYEITWNTIPVQTGATATGLSAGLYSALIVDSAGCVKYHVVTITEPSILTIGMSADATSCNGSDDGEATATVVGGTPSYSFLWSDGQTSITATGLVSGTYTVTVTDFASCSATMSVVIAQPTAINVSGVVINVNCNGNSNGKVTLSVSGGSGVYSYLWNTNPARTTKNLNNVAAGTYSVVVSDNSGCSALQTFVIEQPDILACNGTVSDANCNNGATGSIVISPSGGTLPYTILWSNGNTTSSNQNLVAGTYSVTITDINNCSTSCTYIIANSASVIVNATVQNITCNGNANGSIAVNLIGGVGPFTYLWSNGVTTLSVSGLVAGDYTLTITDNTGCTSAANYTITEPEVLSCICNSNITNVSCYGGSNGSITVQPQGGTAPYSYLWSSGALTQTISGLTAGIYTVTITDANGCQKIGIIQVTQPAQLYAFISCVNNATCYGNNNGSACVNGSGGKAPYTYSWNTVPIQTTYTATGLASGTYTATVTDINGCTSTATIVINQPTSSLSCTTLHTNVICYGQSNGQATVNPSGGTGPYTYQWNTIPAKTTKTVLGLKAGAYTVIVTDAFGCSCASLVTIGQPPQLLALASATNVSCNGGSDGAIAVTVTGGTPSYTYNWSNGATSKDISNLSAGTYQLTITDNKGCIAIINVVLIQPAQLSCSTGSSNVSCNNGTNGSVFVVVSGGSTPYSYLWSNGGINANNNGLSAGTYTVTVTDSKGCTTTCSATVTQPTQLNCSVAVLKNVTCGANNGKLEVTVTGGTPTYTYLWSTIPIQTSAIATGLAPGSYSVLVSDMMGCTTICTGSLGGSTTVNCNISGTNVTCNGGNNGTATVNPTGGTTPYSYLWNTVTAATTASVSDLTAGTYIATVTDADGCTSICSIIITEPSALTVSMQSTNVNCNGNSNGTATVNPSGGTPPYGFLWSNGATSETITGLVVGTYTVTVTDNNGCTKQDEAIVTQPSEIICSTSTTSVNCNNGSNGTATVNASGGVAPLTYAWNTSPVQSTTTATGLVAGNYTVTITDASGCTKQCTALVEEPGATLSCSVSTQNVTCFGGNNGSATVTPTGGVTPYSYSWNTLPVQTNATATGLTSGLYTVVVIDANGCSSSCFETVTQPLVLSCAVNVIQTSCGNANGEATVNPNGGSPSYSFLWSNGATDQALINLGAGIYTVTVTDANGCTSSCEANINGSTAVIFTTANTPSTCNSVCDGTGTVVAVLGGISPYTYQWSNGNTNSAATNLCVGVYTVTVLDNVGCSSTQSITITEPSAIVLSFSDVINVGCNGGTTGQAKINPTGGTPSYSYLWSNGTTDQTATGLLAGTYTVTVTDQNGCTATNSLTISQSGQLTFTQNQTNVLCFGAATGTATVTPIGGTSPFNYLWSNGQTNQTATGLIAGFYTVTVNDNGGCSIVANYNISQPSAIVCGISQSNPTCNGNCDGFATAVISGGMPDYTFVWSNGQTTQTSTGLCAGTYMVTTSDLNGCTSSCSVTLIDAVLLSCNVSTTPVTCNGLSNGTTTANPTGGTAPYTFVWSNGQTTQTATGLTSGTFTVDIADQNNCQTSCSGTVAEPAALDVSITNIINSTCGLNNGSAEATATGGSPNYTYSWSNGQSGPSLVNVGFGTYTVTVTDNNQCSATQSVTITGTMQLNATISGNNLNCNGDNSGSATITVNGGDGNYTYGWNTNPIQTTQTATGLSASEYVVLVTDGNGCTVADSITLVQPDVLSCNANASPGGCGAANGTADVTPIGGTLPYSYLWSNGATTAALTNLSPKTYTVTVTDGNNCTTSCSAIVTGGPKVKNVKLETSKITCFGAQNGSICIDSIYGGTAPFSYLWSNGATTLCLTNMSKGTYTVTVTDINGCSFVNSGTIIEPPLLECSTVLLNNATCGACDGSAKVNVVGGIPVYSRVWNTTPVQTTTTATGLCAGTYTVSVTDNKGCTTSCSVTISSVNALVCSITKVKPSCNGGNNGTANVTVTGAGVYPVSYLWNNGQTTQTATGLSAGTYTVTTTSTAGCTTSCSTTIADPVAVSCSITTLASPSCGKCNGKIKVIPAGGTGPYTYSWNTSPNLTTAKLTKLCSGSYTVTVTDSKGCTSQCSVNLTAIEGPICNITGNTTICSGSSTQLCAPLGLSAYLWSTGATTQCIETFTAGNYSVTITNSAGCTSNCSVIVTVNELPVCNISGTTAICDGGTTELCAPAGAGNYLWSNGATTACITVALPGNYTVTVTSLNGCTSSCSANVSIAQAPVCNITGNTTICPGTSTELCAPSGLNSYLWSTGATTSCINVSVGGNYSVMVTSSLGCTSTCDVNVTENELPVCSIIQNGTYCGAVSSPQLCATIGMSAYLWSTGATTRCIDVPSAGTYTVTITNSSGCTATCSQYVSPGTPITSINFSKTNISCFGVLDGSVCVTSVSGGTAPLTYLWSNGVTNACITNLGIGTYTVTVTDVNGCTQMRKTTITQPGSAVSCNVSNFGNASCSACDGFATVIASGGSFNYSYSWNSVPVQTTATATGLCAGVYFVTVSDQNGCTSSCSVSISGTNPISCSITPLGVSCFGGANGSATVNTFGATGSLTYLWSNGQTNQTATGLTATTYSVTVTATSGCTTNCATLINEPSAITINFTNIVDVSCNGGNNGSASVSANGGTGSLSYLWSNGSTNLAVNALFAGTYTVTVTDQNSCTASDEVTIEEPILLTCSVDINNGSCGLANGSATVNPNGGTAGYTYLWNNGATTATINGLGVGNYSVTVTDVNGCTTQCNGTVIAGGTASLTINKTKISCFGGNNGTATANPAGSIAPYSYLWSDGQTTKTATGLSAQQYTVTITSSVGCTASGQVTILEAAQIIASISSQTNVSCFGGSDGVLSGAAIGGNAGAFSYSWSNGATTKTITLISAGTYTVTVTDSKGCTGTVSTVVTQPTQIAPNASATAVSCNGGQTGAASVNPIGGTGSLSVLWSNGNTTNNIIALAAGTYTATVTDANGCSATQSVVVSQPTAIGTPTASITNVSCFEGCNGTIALNAITGGTSPYTYIWSNGTTTTDANQLCAGTYTVTVNDANSCSVTASFTISQPNVLSTLTSQTNVSSCNNTDGSASVTPSGGTAPYTYLWSNASTNSAISNLAAGTYFVTVTDVNGCTATASVTLTQPAYVCSTFVSGHKQTYYDPLGCTGCDTIHKYALAKFSTAFPSGMTIGCSSGFSIHFTNVNSVFSFLPSSGNNSALTQNYIDPPASPLDNGLASQIATLAMTIQFDLTDPNFAPTSTVNFKDLIVDTVGPWNGKTIEEIFNEAQRQLGGCPASFPISKSQLSVITSRINSSWDLGNNFYGNILACPANTCSGNPPKLVHNANGEFNVTAFPNPTDDKLNLVFNATTQTHYHIKMMDMKGGLVLSQEHESNIGSNQLTLDLNSLPKGLYMIQVMIGDHAKTIKIVLQ